MEDLIQLLFFILIIGFGLFVKFLQKVSGSVSGQDRDIDQGSNQWEGTPKDHSPWESPWNDDTRSESEPKTPPTYDRRQERSSQENVYVAQQEEQPDSFDRESPRQKENDSPQTAFAGDAPTYERQTSSYHSTPTVETKAEKPDHEDAWQTGHEVGDESLRRAFPKRRQRLQGWQQKRTGTIQVDAKGAQNLRRAILMNEVIARPRAFDV